MNPDLWLPALRQAHGRPELSRGPALAGRTRVALKGWANSAAATSFRLKPEAILSVFSQVLQPEMSRFQASRRQHSIRIQAASLPAVIARQTPTRPSPSPRAHGLR